MTEPLNIHALNPRDASTLAEAHAMMEGTYPPSYTEQHRAALHQAFYTGATCLMSLIKKNLNTAGLAALDHELQIFGLEQAVKMEAQLAGKRQ